MSRFQNQSRYRWLVLTLVFGVGPVAVYLTLINPSVVRISNCRDKIALQASGAALLDLGPAPASGQETEELHDIRVDQLARVKKIDSRESLLGFSAAFADAVAFQARSFGLHVIGVNLENSLINGSYVPASDRAMETLAGLPGPGWEELADPLDVPSLRLPFIEIDVIVSAEYSQVFSFVESLSDFPSLSQLTGLRTTDDASGKAYRLKIRGYYCGNENIRQTPPPADQSAENEF